jgi:hypothetical protein
MTLSSSRRTRDYHVDSSLGGGSPAYTTAAGAIPTAVEDRPSRLLVTSFLRFVSTMVSGQIGFLSSCRSRRKKHHRKWCTVAHVWVLSSRRPSHPGGSIRLDRAEVEGNLLSHQILDGRSRLERK